MTRKPGPKSGTRAAMPERAPRKPAPRDDVDDAEDSGIGDGAARIISRPDGHHWLSLDGRREFGPFDSYEEALADMQSDAEETAVEPGETLQEAETELGIADWIDPDSGEPAEGLSTPRLRDE